MEFYIQFLGMIPPNGGARLLQSPLSVTELPGFDMNTPGGSQGNQSNESAKQRKLFKIGINFWIFSLLKGKRLSEIVANRF